MNERSVALAGWGRYPVAHCKLIEPDSPEELAQYLGSHNSTAIARGNGRSYGDSSLSPECTIGTRRLDRMLAFDDGTGTLTCEAGTLLSDVIDTFVPRGWFPPVTPGTKFVTIGGMIAADVHGKNHHLAGSFCDHLLSIDIAIGDGTILRCSPTENTDLFAATCGGMGLTGIIVRATFRLIRIATSRIEQTIVRAPDLASSMETFEKYERCTYSVAWIDCLSSGAALGRSVVMVGEHATVDQLPPRDRCDPYARKLRAMRRLPIDLPAVILNRATVGAFNDVYYGLQRPGKRIVQFERYFYPLDAIRDWNRMYGHRGFVQYQCVFPLSTSRKGLTELLSRIAQSGFGSFLTVLKRLGPGSFGYLSFPMEGYTLALDFPVKSKALELLDQLDDIVAAHGGRVYLTKDARVSARHVAAGYPGLSAFREVRRRYQLQGRFQSLQSKRLEL